MRAILEYITMNYTWFLGAAIIILLAIIGSYADKTNFGQGKPSETKKEIPNPEETNNKELEPTNEEIKEEEIIDGNQEQLTPEQMANLKEDDKLVVAETENHNINKKESFEENFEKFDQEFDAIIPRKDIIDEELLDEIDNLSLDKTQKLKLTDIPDLDDLDLPKIKSLDPVDEDIWKF